jgi:hypothetical protein
MIPLNSLIYEENCIFFFISVGADRQGNRQRMVRIPPLLIGINVELGNQGVARQRVAHRGVAHRGGLRMRTGYCARDRRPSVTLTICPPITCLTCTSFRAPPNHANRFMTRLPYSELKGHGNEPNFPRFLHKSLWPTSLTLHFEPFRFWLRIRGDIRIRKTTPRIGESTRLPGVSIFLKPLNNSIVIVHYIPGQFLAKLIL